MRLTPAVKNFIILNVGVFILQMVSPVVTYYGSLHPIGSEGFFPTQFFTYMFLHSPDGFYHIFFNMLILFFMGPILEMTIGDKKFILLYMTCGLAAGAMELAVGQYMMGNQYSIILGASGAVAGVLVGTAIFYPNMEIMIYFLFPVKLKYVAMFYVAYDLFNGLGNTNTGVAHFAHLGGVLFAVILIKYWKDRGEIRF